MAAGNNEKRDLFMKPLLPPERASHQLGVAAIYLDLVGVDPVVVEFDPVVAESESRTISDTCLVSGSINMIRSGSFTKSRFFASGT